MLPATSYAYLYATLQGHENDLRVDGRNVHLVVAGYGGGLGMSTYQMAVSRAKKLKENFPNDRVIILGSTPYDEVKVTQGLKTATRRLEQDYDISIHDAYKEGGSQAHMVTAPLTADNFAAAALYSIADPNSLREFYRRTGGANLSEVAQSIRNGSIRGAGKLRSIDFITHSSPIDGIFLHNSVYYNKPVSAADAMRARSQGKVVIEEEGKYFVKELIAGNVQEATRQRTLSAASSQISALNGMFTDDAYVNMAGCSGGYGMVEDLSKALGVPVSGSANGGEVYVMAQNGDYYYNYETSNPFESKPLSESIYANLGHELGANNDYAPPMGFKPALSLYRGFWGDMHSGTNFTVTACVVREAHKDDDTARCEMGMARRIEDALTASNSKGEKFEIKEGMSKEEITAMATAKYKNFLNTLKENMCPDGRGQRAYSERYPEVRNQCFKAIDTLGLLSINCNVQASELAQARSVAELAGRFPNRYKEVCTRQAQNYIDNYKHFVPLLDREGKTLVCDLNGCRVRLVGCHVTQQERQQCVSSVAESYPQIRSEVLNPSCLATNDSASACFKTALNQPDLFKEADRSLGNCLQTKRCQIDEDFTQASNKDNPTFMNFIQHYLNGYVKLEKYRRGDLKIESSPPPPQPLSNASPSTLSHLEAQGLQ